MFLGFFFTLFLILLFVVAIGGSIIRGIFNMLFGRAARHSYGTAQGGSSHSEQRHQSTSHNQRSTTANSQKPGSSGGKKREKIFEKTDGEYVDFEEIKE